MVSLLDRLRELYRRFRRPKRRGAEELHAVELHQEGRVCAFADNDAAFAWVCSLLRPGETCADYLARHESFGEEMPAIVEAIEEEIIPFPGPHPVQLPSGVLRFHVRVKMPSREGGLSVSGVGCVDMDDVEIGDLVGCQPDFDVLRADRPHHDHDAHNVERPRHRLEWVAVARLEPFFADHIGWARLRNESMS